MRYAKGIMWLDNCRIPFVDEKVPRLNVSYQHKTNNNFGGGNDGRYETSTQSIQEGQGRFTPNLLVCDDVLNDGVIYKSGDGSGVMELININDAHHFSFDNPNRKITKMKGVQYNDKGSNSRYYDLDKWFSKMVDEIR